MSGPDWLIANRRNWDERVHHHLSAASYDMRPLFERRARLAAIEEAELGPVAGLRILHLQCHFGRDSLILAQRGAEVVGLDFSPEAIRTARRFAEELGLAGRARFVEADLYAASGAIGETAGFDRVFVTWGALCWLPDIAGWARIAAGFLAPGGRLYLADHHPAAQVFDDAVPDPAGRPGWAYPYFERGPHVTAEPQDYTGERPALTGGPSTEWAHPLGEVVTAVIGAGLRLERLTEHDGVPWHMFACLERGEDGLCRWPDRPWLPLSFSLSAARG